jgi:hypothetical protein
VPTHQQHGGGPPFAGSSRSSTTRTKLAASYEALLTGGDISRVAVAAGLGPPTLVLSDAWLCPSWWDEHLLLKVCRAEQHAQPRSLQISSRPCLEASTHLPWARHFVPSHTTPRLTPAFPSLTLQVDAPWFLAFFARVSPLELLGAHRRCLAHLFTVCLRFLSDAHALRATHAAETLSLLLFSVHTCFATKGGPSCGHASPASVLHSLACLCGGDSDVAQQAAVHRLLTSCIHVMAQPLAPSHLRIAASRLLLTAFSLSPNVNANAVIGLAHDMPAAGATLVQPLIDLALATQPDGAGAGCDAHTADVLHAACLASLALLLSWSHGRNVVSSYLGGCSHDQLARLLDVATLHLRDRPLAASPHATPGAATPTAAAGDAYYPMTTALLTDAVSYVAATMSGSASAASHGQPTSDAVSFPGLSALHAQCAPRAWSHSDAAGLSLTNTCCAALLLHAIVAHSRLLTQHKAWLPAPGHGGGAVDIATSWRTALGTLFTHTASCCSALIASAAGPECGGDAACAACVTLHCSSIALVLEDPRGCEFMHSTSAARLLLPPPSSTLSAPPHGDVTLGDTVLELCACVLRAANAAALGAQHMQGAAQLLDAAAVSSLASAHAVVHHVAQGAASRREAVPRHVVHCAPLWTHAAATMLRFSLLGGKPGASRLALRAAAQATSLLSAACACCHVIQRPGPAREALFAPVLALRPYMGTISAACETSAGADQQQQQHGDSGDVISHAAVAASTSWAHPRVDLSPLVAVQTAMGHLVPPGVMAAAPRSDGSSEVSPAQLVAVFTTSLVSDVTCGLWGNTRDVARCAVARLDGVAAAGDGPAQALVATKAALARLLAAAHGARPPRVGDMDAALQRLRTPGM